MYRRLVVLDALTTGVMVVALLASKLAWPLMTRGVLMGQSG